MVEFGELRASAAAHHRAGRWQEAEQQYRKILTHSPDQADVRRDLAWLLYQRGDRASAIDQLRRAIADDPSRAIFHSELGVMLRGSGLVDEAVPCFEEAIRLDPGLWQAQFNLGNALQQLGRFDRAVQCYTNVLRLAPDDADVHLNLGVAQKSLGQIDKARASFQRALELRGDFADPWINLGILAKNEGNVPEAVRCYGRALELNPQSAVAYYNLGMAWRAYDHVDAAVDSLRQAVRINPNYVAAHRHLADACAAQGNITEAIAAYGEALRLENDDATRIRCALALPIILESHEQIAQRRSQLQHDLEALAREPLTVKDPLGEIGPPAFALAYHGCNERAFQSQIAGILRRATPQLSYVAPHCARPRQPGDARRIKIGFASMHFRNHTIGKLNAGLIDHLDRDKFQVVVFRGPGCVDAIAQQIAASANHCVTLVFELQAAQAQIAEHELDVLFYTDIGLDGMSYYLAHARLAPLQCVTWGHPLTTGIPTIDTFISSDDLETPGAESHYTEALVRLPRLAVVYFRPEPSTSTKTRRDFGWSDQAHVYACLQAPFKLHPDDDAVFAQILRRDPLGTLVLLEGLSPNWSALLRARFARSIGDVAGRIQFVPQQPPPDFSRLLAAVDVLLDPLHFSGGDTSYQSFAVGTPIVTLPGEFLRSRITYALYRAMGIECCVAHSAEDYVARAVRLGTDEAWRRHVRSQILAANHAIYEDPSGVRALEEFLVGRVELLETKQRPGGR